MFFLAYYEMVQAISVTEVRGQRLGMIVKQDNGQKISEFQSYQKLATLLHFQEYIVDFQGHNKIGIA